ncbi:hypothetical protein VHP8226_02702 [Vibrio hippocampi]|uniref:O-spanin n=1 Tax=Vibrio hippocampi TaxID=654686 RepID=A0ABM8ZKB3_9VIBR|nr:hypothetical protein VHP8226_02702 [Vibrio hippocampi]
MMNKGLSVALVSLLTLAVSGCSSQQLHDIGLPNPPINRYPENMTDTQLCEVATGNRATNQTVVALEGEMFRRRITLPQCHQRLRELYLTQWWASFSKEGTQSDDNATEPTPLPAIEPAVESH